MVRLAVIPDTDLLPSRSTTTDLVVIGTGSSAVDAIETLNAVAVTPEGREGQKSVSNWSRSA